MGITKKGTMCLNKTKHASGFCAIHLIKGKIKETSKVQTNSPVHQLDMGDLSEIFPLEIIHQILSHLNLFDLSRVSRVNRSCRFVVKDLKMIDEKEKNEFEKFVKDFKSKPTIVGYDVLKKYRIPHPRQHLILFPKNLIQDTYFYSRSRHKHNSVDKQHYESFCRKFLSVPSTMVSVLSGSTTIWNFQSLFLFSKKVKRFEETYSLILQ
jgi:hypothetical protein